MPANSTMLSAYSKALGGSSNTEADLQITGSSGGLLQEAGRIYVWNRTGVETFCSVDGTTPTVAGPGMYIIPAVISPIPVVIAFPSMASVEEQDALATITLKAIAASAWSLWVQATV